MVLEQDSSLQMSAETMTLLSQDRQRHVLIQQAMCTPPNQAEAYTASGQNFFSLEALLQPLEATAYRCKLPWHPPFLAYRANKLDVAELDRLGRDYCACLEGWRREVPAKRPAN